MANGRIGVEFPVLATHEAHLALAEGEDAVDVGERRANGDGTVLAQHLVGEEHIVHADGHAVVPVGIVAEAKGDPVEVRPLCDAVGQAAIGADRLVDGGFEQPVVHEAASVVIAGRDPALLQNRVVVVEGAHHGQSHPPGLRRVWVGVVEVGEVGAVFQRQQVGDGVGIVGVFARRRFGGRGFAQGGERSQESKDDRGRLGDGQAFGGKAFCLPYAPAGASLGQAAVSTAIGVQGKAECLPSKGPSPPPPMTRVHASPTSC